jgi:hypothetical protein
MSQIKGELERIRAAFINPRNVVSAEMLAEELACRAMDRRYEWDPDRISAHFDSPTGLAAEVVGNETDGRVEIKIEWKRKNPAHHSTVTKWIPKAAEQAYAILRKAGWSVKGGTTVGYTVGVEASIRVHDVAQRVGEHSRIIAEVMKVLTFDHA